MCQNAQADEPDLEAQTRETCAAVLADWPEVPLLNIKLAIQASTSEGELERLAAALGYANAARPNV
jgi:hypothetical protein